MSQKKQVKIYGNDHSPWVQAVMLGLHEKNMDYDRSTVPSFEVLKKWGPMMPAASIDGGPWFLESRRILQQIGFSEVNEKDILAVRQSWTGVMHRADYWTRFWGEFSLASDPNPVLAVRLAKNFLRAITILYFFLLIRLGVMSRGYQDPQNHADAFLYWEQRLTNNVDEFFEGINPGSLDFLLFGIVQCHCSIPVPTVVSLQTDPRLINLRSWISRMQTRYENYSSLYSCRYFQPHAEGPTPATGLEQFVFWLGALFWLAIAPISLPAIFIFIYRNRNLRGA